jgi:hypothetical protein
MAGFSVLARRASGSCMDGLIDFAMVSARQKIYCDWQQLAFLQFVIRNW